MALTFTRTQRPSVIGDRKMVAGVVTFDSVYPTGGEDAAASLFGLKRLDHLIVNQPASRIAVWVPSTGKILLRTNISTEAVNGTDQSAVTVHVVAIGK
jgi:hypothetical protein